MKRRHLFWIAMVLGLIWMAGPGPARSQEVAAAGAPEPRRVEIRTSPHPTRMLAEEGLLYLERLRQQRLAAAPSVVDETTPEESADAQNDVRIYEVDEPPVVNPTQEFRFDDATARHDPVRPVLTMEQRRAAVETFRREAARGKNSKPQRRGE